MRKNLIFLGLLAAVFLGLFAFSGRCAAPANGEQAIRKATAAYLEAMNNEG